LIRVTRPYATGLCTEQDKNSDVIHQNKRNTTVKLLISSYRKF